MNVRVGESKSFRVDGVQSTEFVFVTKVENPRVLTLTFDGELGSKPSAWFIMVGAVFHQAKE